MNSRACASHSTVSGASPGEKGEFSRGSPVFADSRLAHLQKTRGDLAAWRSAFSESGAKAPQGVSGDYAVSVRLADGRSFLAVDRFAIRSLCYRLDQGRLHAGERADAVAAPRAEIDHQALFDYFYFHVIPSPRTIFRHVFRVPPGHCVLYDEGQLSVTPYWVPNFEENRHASFRQLKEEFRHLLESSVRRQLDGRRVGCYLSGGTDSSTVAGMLSRQGAVSAYSIGFDAAGYDEMEYARLAARHFGVSHHEYYVTPDDLVRSIPAIAGHYDQPFGNSSALPGYYCALRAREDGIEKLLAGDGGDELFGGNSRYARQRILDWYRGIPAPLRRHVMEPLSPRLASLPLLKKVDSYIRQARVPMPGRSVMDGLLMRLGMENLFTPAMLDAFDPAAPLRQQERVWNVPRADSLINRMLAFDWRYTLAENDLPKVCGSAALADMDVGFPLLDQRIVDFSLRLPPDYKLRGLQLRWFFKEALRGFLPDEILAKKKHGFGLPFGVWATRHKGLAHLAEESVRGLVERGMVRHDFIDRLLREHLPAQPNYYGEMVWIMMMLEQWLRAHAPAYALPPGHGQEGP